MFKFIAPLNACRAYGAPRQATFLELRSVQRTEIGIEGLRHLVLRGLFP